jgi:hypothetical protein
MALNGNSPESWEHITRASKNLIFVEVDCDEARKELQL